MKAALAMLTLAGCQPPAPAPPGNIVLVVMDTVRVDHLSAWGYERGTSPFLESLAGEGTRYERAWSSSAWTLPAHASMFTGLPPRLHGADQTSLHLRGQPSLLAERLATAGYQTAGFSNNPWVSGKTGLAGGFEHFAELWRRDQRPWTLWDDPTSEAVAGWLVGERDPEKPFFLFVNLMEAHGPYEPAWSHAWPMLGPVGAWQRQRRYGAGEERGFVRSWYLGEEPVPLEAVEAALDLYDAEIHQADAAVARIVRAVDRVADPASTTLLVVTDHGEAFGEHGLMGHNFSLCEPLLRVAFLARGPGFAAGAVERGVVQLTDVFPTLLAAAGLPWDAQEGAMDLHAAPPETRPLEASYAYPRQVFGTFPPAQRKSRRLDPYRRSIAAGLDGRFKLVRDSKGHEEVFDLLADPGEEHPLEQPDPAVVARLRALAQGLEGDPGEGGELDDLDPETAAELERLGYLDGDGMR
ncbi:MAG: sulfatase [Pseudomonadota bacterium]